MENIIHLTYARRVGRTGRGLAADILIKGSGPHSIVSAAIRESAELTTHFTPQIH